MAAGEEASPRSGVDVLRTLRTATAREHEQVESALDLMSPDLDRARLADVLGRLHAFWRAAEAGLDDWAEREPEPAGAVEWGRRRRAALFAADLAALGAESVPGLPVLPDVEGTDEALGRMYVLEGSTLGGTFIDRHLAGLPGLGVRVTAFSPYGAETGAMWHAFRRFTRERVSDPDRAVAAAGATFRALAAWCAPVAA
ncbi:biliverdin-producing heme oxygenase [Geodermatophilus sp. URMC 64]